MIPVEQRRLWRPADHPDGPQRGDCLRACVASILEVPYEDAPDLDGTSSSLYDWMKDAMPGLRPQYRDLTGNEPETLDSWRSWPTEHHEQGYWIAAVYSHRIPDVHEFGCGCADRTNGKGDPTCEWCGGHPERRSMGIRWGLHAVVMRSWDLVWDPHPERDKGVGPFRGATTFHVDDLAPAARAFDLRKAA